MLRTFWGEFYTRRYDDNGNANASSHPEYLEEEDDDGDVDLKDADGDAPQSNGVPKVPEIPSNLANGN
jgi:hypothetical protein